MFGKLAQSSIKAMF
ncbi:TPA: hypothetical protein ACNTDO_000248 [Escherichia coli]